jgi:response regulator RpfG family c-di-GMP phosphodiesterase
MSPEMSKEPMVVILSSFEKNADTDKIINSPRVIRYLTKPLSPQIFEEILREMKITQLKVA